MNFRLKYPINYLCVKRFIFIFISKTCWVYLKNPVKHFLLTLYITLLKARKIRLGLIFMSNF